MTAVFKWAFHLRTLHLSTDECGGADVGDLIDVTLKCFGVKWPELPLFR